MRTVRFAIVVLVSYLGVHAAGAAVPGAEDFRLLRAIPAVDDCELVRLAGTTDVVSADQNSSPSAGQSDLFKMLAGAQSQMQKTVMDSMRRERRKPLPAATALQVNAGQKSILDIPVSLTREIFTGFSVSQDVLNRLDSDRYLAVGPAPESQGDGSYLLDAGPAGVHFVALTVRPVVGLTASEQPLWLQLESSGEVLTGNRLESRTAIINWSPACLHADITLGEDWTDIGSDTRVKGGELRIRPDGIYVSTETSVEQTAPDNDESESEP